MGLAKCLECGREVSSSASKCPHCGIANPAVGKAARTAIGAGTALVVGPFVLFALVFAAACVVLLFKAILGL